MSIIVKGYCIKYGNSIASHGPIKKGCLMRDPSTQVECAVRYHIPVYVRNYEDVKGSPPDGFCNIYKRKDGIYAICSFDIDAVNVEYLKPLKIGCYASNVVCNKNNEIVDGYIRYVNLCKTNIERIDEIIIQPCNLKPDALYNKEE